MREAAPDLNIFYAADRPRSHVNPLGDIAAQGRASACEAAFFVALAQLAEAARSAGGKGIVNLRSPAAESAGAPTYICTRLSPDRAEVRLAASAARLNGSDAPYVPRTRAGGRLPALMPVQGRPLPLALPIGENTLAMPSARARYYPGQLFAQPAINPHYLRRVTDIRADGSSAESCLDAFKQALSGLIRQAAEAGGEGVAAIRSTQLDHAREYVCTVSEGEMSVSLIGTATGRPVTGLE